MNTNKDIPQATTSTINREDRPTSRPGIQRCRVGDLEVLTVDGSLHLAFSILGIIKSLPTHPPPFSLDLQCICPRLCSDFVCGVCDS